jgi:hypothetical protein
LDHVASVFGFDGLTANAVENAFFQEYVIFCFDLFAHVEIS